MIEKFYIQKLRDLDILKVADALGMGLRQKRALCIHHDDHHPSLMFNVRKNTCHCYSCGFSADTITLVRERLNLGFMEACHWLADHFDVYIGEEKREPKGAGERKQMGCSRMMEKAPQVDVEYYSQLFVQKKVSATGLKFLLEERMLSPAVIDLCHIVGSECNVCMSRVGQSVFDGPLLLFPYLGMDGSIISVQSRYLGKESGVARFKFAPGSHRMVYGLDRLASYPSEEPLLITEGPSDCWTALTLGFHAIAIPSATLFDKHLEPLLKGKNLHMFPDQDVPGLSLYFELKSAFPQLAYHQLPEGSKDLSDYYLRLRHEGRSLEEATQVVTASLGQK